MSLLLSTPWRRGPLLLLRRPGVFLALAAAAFVAALPAASAPLFLVSARNATLHHQASVGCPWTAGATTTTFTGIPSWQGGRGPEAPRKPTADSIRDQRRAATSSTPEGLGAPMFTIYGFVPITAAGGPAPPVGGGAAPPVGGGAAPPVGGGAPLPPQQVNLISRDDFAGHVEIRAGTPGPGLWLPHRLAASLGVQAGGRVAVGSTSVPVAVVYTDLRSLPDQPYWCGVRELYRGFPGQEFTNTPVYDTVLLDQATFLELDTALGGGGATHYIDWPVRDLDAMTYEDAVRTNEAIAALPRRLRESGQFPGGLFQRQASVVAPVREGVGSRLPRATGRAAFVGDALGPPVVPITGAGVAVGLLVVGAAAVFWVQRRRQELAVLAAHGAGPAALGVKAFVESLPALATGAVAGWLSSWALIGTVGPDPVLSPAAPRLAALGVAATLVLACLVVGVAAGLRTRALTDQTERRHRTGPLATLPWELALFVVAALAWRLLGEQREVVDAAGAGAIAVVPARLLVVPILVVAGLVVLGGRIGVRLARRRRRVHRRPARLLARRRLARHAVIATVLAGATAVPVALATYGGVVTGTVQSTVDGEARLQVGADVVATLAEPADVPAALAGRATPVTRLSQVSVGGIRAEVLAVDPRTFADGAFWHDDIPGSSLAELAGRLRGGDRGIAIGTAPLATGDAELSWGGSAIGRLTVDRTSVLPGPRGGYPVLLVDRSALRPEALDRGVPEMWVRGDAMASIGTLARSGVPIVRFFAAEERFANSSFEALTFTFAYLAALSVLTGLVSLVGLLLYLESRTPAMRRAYVLLRRMGLRAGAHRRALLAELTVPLLIGLVGGLAMVVGLTVALRSQLELDPSTPPGPLVSLPLAEVAGTVAAVLVIALLATLFAQVRTGRAAPSEVLRDAN